LEGAVNVTVPTPWTDALLSWTITVAVDRYGNVYGGTGPGIGKSSGSVSGSATANWMMNGCGTPSEDQLEDFLTGLGYNITAGAGVGISESWNDGNDWALGLGFVSPQIGAGATGSWEAPLPWFSR